MTTKIYKRQLDALQLTSIRGSDRIPHNRGIFQLGSNQTNLGLTKLQYVTRLCSDEKVKVTVRINPTA